jgi:serine phosphatase RsbU (regulator of sigma subunit)/pSer/pThr/pTyr-binding forkhead associated (FHA) protein
MHNGDPIGPRLELDADRKPRRSFSIGASGLTIGREATATIRFEEPHISRQHARIERHPDGGFYLVDTSRNQSTYLNDRRLLEARPVRLEDGDRIRIGDHEMIFRCESKVVPVDADEGSAVLETLSDLSSDHLAERARRPAATLRAVLNVNRSLGGGGDLDDVLGRVLSGLMELFPNTETGVIVTVEPDGRLPVRAIRHRGGPPPKLTLSRTILRQVIEQGAAALIRDAAKDARFKEHGSIDALFRSALCVPIPGSGGKSVGMIQLGVREDRRNRFTSDDLEMLAALALPIAAAVENDRLLRERAHWAAARGIQLALLPRARPEISGYSFWECYRPALEVGGDSYDYIPVAKDGRHNEPEWVVGVGDVAGKGMPAALLAAAVCPEVRHAVRSAGSVAEALSCINRYVYDLGFDTSFVTMILAHLNPRTHRITIASAGHELPLIRRAAGSVERIELPNAGLPLGVLADAPYALTSLELAPGDVLVLYSDGLSGALDRHRRLLDPERLVQTLSHAPAMASRVGEDLLAAVMSHSEGIEPADDLTMVCIGRDAA